MVDEPEKPRSGAINTILAIGMIGAMYAVSYLQQQPIRHHIPLLEPTVVATPYRRDRPAGLNGIEYEVEPIFIGEEPRRTPTATPTWTQTATPTPTATPTWTQTATPTPHSYVQPVWTPRCEYARSIGSIDKMVDDGVIDEVEFMRLLGPMITIAPSTNTPNDQGFVHLIYEFEGPLPEKPALLAELYGMDSP